MPVEYSAGATAQEAPVFEQTHSPTNLSGDQKLKCIGRYILTGNTLGKGNFARVEEASHCLTETKVAIKIIDIDRIQEDYVRKNLLREAKLMRGLKHPNIIRLYETMKTSHLYCMVTELADGGELLSHVRHDYKERRLPEAAARPFVRQLVSALQHLHSQGIVHRDLKMENILLDKKKRYTKIVDFGLSNAAQPGSLLATHCGSPEYAAPELFIPGRQYGPEVDIWSLGVNMFAMMVGKLPFRSPKQGARKRQRLLEMISNGLSEAHEKEMQHLTPACIDMIKMLLQPDISSRANLDDIMVHPWITKNGHYPLLPFKPLPPDPSVKQSALDLVCKSGNVTVEEVHDSVEKDKCDWMSALYHILVDSSEARRIVQKKLKAETKKGGSKPGSKESSKQSLLEYSFSLGERGSSDFFAYEYESAHATSEGGGDNDPTPIVEESFVDINDMKAGQNTLRLHRNPIGTWERRRSASHPLDPDQLKDETLNRQDISDSINYSDAPSARPRIPRTMTHQYRDGEAVVPRAATSRKSSAGNPPAPAYTLVHYESDKSGGDAPMQRSTSLDMRSGYNPTHTWDRLRNKSTQPQISYNTQTSNQPYHTTPRPNTNTDSFGRRPYEYMDEGVAQHSKHRTSNYGHSLNTPMALSVDWAQYNQSLGNSYSGSLKKGKRSTHTSYLEHLNDYNTPTAQQTLPQRKTKDRHSIMPALNPDNTSTLPGYKISFSDTPLDAKQVSNTLPSRTKKPSKMPGTRGYIKNKDSADNPTRMLSNPEPNVSPFSVNRGNNVYDFTFTGTGGYMWVSDQQLSKSKEALDKSEKRKTFWKFRSKNKSKENLVASNTSTNKPVTNEGDTGVYVTLSKKNLFTSSIHNLHKPADITSLYQDSGNSNTAAQKMETDLVSKPTPNFPPMEESTPTTRIKVNSRKSALQQTPVTQVKPVTIGASASASASASAPTPQSLDNSTHTTHIKVQLQQAIDGMNIEYKNQEIHEGGYMSDSGLATPVSSARDVERPTSSKRLRSLLVRPFKSGKKKA